MSLLLERKRSGLEGSYKRAVKNHSSWVEDAAKAMGVDPKILYGVLAIEVGGRPIRLGRSITKLLMIKNHFIKKYKEKNPGATLPSWSDKPFSGRWTYLDEAISMDATLAYRSTSWGIGQNHAWSYKRLGYSSPKAMVDAFMSSPDAQIRGFIDGIRKKPVLYRAMRVYDWWAIGRYYNGSHGGQWSYAAYLRHMYNAASAADQQDNSQIHNSIKSYCLDNPSSGWCPKLIAKKGWRVPAGRTAGSGAQEQKYARLGKAPHYAGFTPQGVHATGAATGRQGAKIVLIGDSNANRLNNEYEKHYASQGAEVLKFHRNGSGCRHWLEVLKKVERLKAGDRIGSGERSQAARKIYDFKPTKIDVVCLGGNNMNLIYNQSSLRSHISGCIKPLMEEIKKWNGTFAGTVAVGKSRVGKNGEPSNVLRARMNAEYAKVANEVGIPFWNPTTRVAYDTAALSKRTDSVHITRAMASKEFESRKTFLNHGLTPGMPGGNALMQALGFSGPGQNRLGKPGTRQSLVPELSVSPEEFIDWYVAAGGPKVMEEPSLKDIMAAASAAWDKANPSMAGALDKKKRPAGQDDPTKPKPPTPPDTPEEACPAGAFVSKYKNFPDQVPDFDFTAFYNELDKYFGSAEEELKPQGKDCVFGDEHYIAWSRLQQRKQQQAPYVAESMSMLKGLIKEMKKRY